VGNSVSLETESVKVTRLQEHMLKLSEEHGIGEYDICPMYLWGWVYELDQYLLQLSEVLDDTICTY
jgi:hypothetical protein